MEFCDPLDSLPSAQEDDLTTLRIKMEEMNSKVTELHRKHCTSSPGHTPTPPNTPMPRQACIQLKDLDLDFGDLECNTDCGRTSTKIKQSEMVTPQQIMQMFSPTVREDYPEFDQDEQRKTDEEAGGWKSPKGPAVRDLLTERPFPISTEPFSNWDEQEHAPQDEDTFSFRMAEKLNSRQIGEKDLSSSLSDMMDVVNKLQTRMDTSHLKDVPLDIQKDVKECMESLIGRLMEETRYSAPNRLKIATPKYAVLAPGASSSRQFHFSDKNGNLQLLTKSQMDSVVGHPPLSSSCKITASSSWSEETLPVNSRLQVEGPGWIPAHDENQWIQFELEHPTQLHAIATQGRSCDNDDYEMFCTKYKIKIKTPESIDEWVTLPKIFRGNHDRLEITVNVLDEPMLITALRIYPMDWSWHVAMKVELYGPEPQSAMCTKKMSASLNSKIEHMEFKTNVALAASKLNKELARRQETAHQRNTKLQDRFTLERRKARNKCSDEKLERNQELADNDRSERREQILNAKLVNSMTADEFQRDSMKRSSESRECLRKQLRRVKMTLSNCLGVKLRKQLWLTRSDEAEEDRNHTRAYEIQEREITMALKSAESNARVHRQLDRMTKKARIRKAKEAIQEVPLKKVEERAPYESERSLEHRDYAKEVQSSKIAGFGEEQHKLEKNALTWGTQIAEARTALFEEQERRQKENSTIESSAKRISLPLRKVDQTKVTEIIRQLDDARWLVKAAAANHKARKDEDYRDYLERQICNRKHATKLLGERAAAEAALTLKEAEERKKTQVSVEETFASQQTELAKIRRDSGRKVFLRPKAHNEKILLSLLLKHKIAKENRERKEEVKNAAIQLIDAHHEDLLESALEKPPFQKNIDEAMRKERRQEVIEAASDSIKERAALEWFHDKADYSFRRARLKNVQQININEEAKAEKENEYNMLCGEVDELTWREKYQTLSIKNFVECLRDKFKRATEWIRSDLKQQTDAMALVQKQTYRQHELMMESFKKAMNSDDALRSANVCRAYKETPTPPESVVCRRIQLALKLLMLEKELRSEPWIHMASHEFLSVAISAEEARLAIIKKNRSGHIYKPPSDEQAKQATLRQEQVMKQHQLEKVRQAEIVRAVDEKLRELQLLQAQTSLRSEHIKTVKRHYFVYNQEQPERVKNVAVLTRMDLECVRRHEAYLDFIDRLYALKEKDETAAKIQSLLERRKPVRISNEDTGPDWVLIALVKKPRKKAYHQELRNAYKMSPRDWLIPTVVTKRRFRPGNKDFLRPSPGFGSPSDWMDSPKSPKLKSPDSTSSAHPSMKSRKTLSFRPTNSSKASKANWRLKIPPANSSRSALATFCSNIMITAGHPGKQIPSTSLTSPRTRKAITSTKWAVNTKPSTNIFNFNDSEEDNEYCPPIAECDTTKSTRRAKKREDLLKARYQPVSVRSVPTKRKLNLSQTCESNAPISRRPRQKSASVGKFTRSTVYLPIRNVKAQEMSSVERELEKCTFHPNTKRSERTLAKTFASSKNKDPNSSRMVFTRLFNEAKRQIRKKNKKIDQAARLKDMELESTCPFQPNKRRYPTDSETTTTKSRQSDERRPTLFQQPRRMQNKASKQF